MGEGGGKENESELMNSGKKNGGERGQKIRETVFL
jgi:hypothetical protein